MLSMYNCLITATLAWRKRLDQIQYQRRGCAKGICIVITNQHVSGSHGRQGR